MDRPLVTDTAMRELAMVLVVALAGLLFAGLVAFVPWYARGADVTVVEAPPTNSPPKH